ncbi:molybdopterin-dependent oxidoreductase [Humibacillus sp. DSM 29435]|uniref:molybdopterin-dependent oxidoreductase n=1 Tax=Humibacillus sp. DSM 29435 TaxID=1869167 RepID=UPI001C2F29E8|nr:molybdopterin-dependent oxidoreductase [Humibacillus sp. DSM 29435]
MTTGSLTRRGLLAGGTAAAGMSVLQVSGSAQALGTGSAESVPWLRNQGDPPESFPGGPDDEVVLWEDQPPPFPPGNGIGQQLVWDELSTRLTPTDNFFFVSHYNQPVIDPVTWRLGIDGLVARPRSLSLASLTSRPRERVEFTLECAGNTAFPPFIGGIGNAVWGGAPLAPLLKSAKPMASATEVVFWGTDAGAVTIRDDSGVISPGSTGTGTPDPDNPDRWDITINEQFARSMTVAEAMAPGNLLCYEMNGRPLPIEHGYPVRLIAPGWYGVANVKWLSRIELIDHRYAGRFMARDYVTFREQTDALGKVTWSFETVGRYRLKSAPAKVTRNSTGGRSRYQVIGVAWGGTIARVEVSIDGGPWRQARVVKGGRHGDPDQGLAWKLWTFDWGRARSGRHTVASRAIDVNGAVQPKPDDPVIADRRTYWEANQQITRTIVLPS